MKINFKLIKKELYAECDYWFEELGRPTHPVRLARHGQLLLDRNSLYDDLLDLNDRLRDAENKALPYIEKLESFLASYEKQVKDNKRNYGSNNHNNNIIKDSTEVVVTEVCFVERKFKRDNSHAIICLSYDPVNKRELLSS